MNNPNSKASRLKAFLGERWFEEIPGTQIKFFSWKKLCFDVGTYIFIPSTAALIGIAFYAAANRTGKSKPSEKNNKVQAPVSAKSQILDFEKGTSTSKRAPGTLVRVSLLNNIETYSTAPVHARILDQNLGAAFRGGTLIGEATPDTNFDRVTITFKFARDEVSSSRATTLAARALSLDGTLGLDAEKRGGFGARATIGSAAAVGQSATGSQGGGDARSFLVQALTAGLLQEFNTTSQVEKNRSQVLTVNPGTEFFAELTDFFPGAGR
jgi:hypothetical protein